MSESDFLPAASALALAAGRRVMELLKNPLVKTRKADHSLVTNADHEANDILTKGLRRAFPSHGILSEETGLEGPSGSYLWVIDPLDGTKAYAQGSPGFSVMMGLLNEGRPVLGVVYDPLEDRLFEAVKGSGSFCTSAGHRSVVRVSGRRRWEEMPLITSTGFPDALREKLRPALPGKHLPPVNSVGVKVGYLVRGLADVYINHHPVHYWDTLGPLVILEEAGGRMTGWDGAPLGYDLNKGFSHDAPTVASNGARHEELVALLKKQSPGARGIQ